MNLPAPAFHRHVRRALCALAVFTVSLLIPCAAAAATYYVGTNGSDNNSCSASQNISTPKRTITGTGGGIACLTAGDTLRIRAGTYQEAIASVPAGTSWATVVTIAAYPGDKVTLKPGSDKNVIGLSGSATQYIVFDGLVVDGLDGHYGVRLATGVRHVRFQNMEIMNATHSGIYLGNPGGTGYAQFINLDIHGNGRCYILGTCPGPTPHGIYMSTGNNLVENSRIHHNYGYGMQIYSGWAGERMDNNIVRGNRFYNNGLSGDGGPLLVSTGDHNLVYNNLIHDNNAWGIVVQYNNVTNTKIFNNTLYGNASGIVIGSTSTGAVIKNNVVYGNTGTAIDNRSGSTALSNNLTTDPAFVDAVIGNFKLRSGSPAIDRGAYIAEVSTDFDGISRPQGGSHDMGAYEFGGTALLAPTPPANVRIVSTSP